MGSYETSAAGLTKLVVPFIAAISDLGHRPISYLPFSAI